MKITTRTALAIIVAIATLLYLLPWSIAFARARHNTVAIFFLNLFLGWSLIGWVVAFVWACTTPVIEKERGKNASPLYNID